MAEVPTYTELASIYGLQGTSDAMARYGALAADFKMRYGEPAKLFARAPGRVNLIGEHVDYEGYGVLPMAVARDTVVAISLSGTTIDVSNNDDALYPAYSFVPDPSQLLDTENHVWANYALAAYKGVHDYLAVNPAAESDVSRTFPGIKLLIHGTVPLGSGLSSSSALVVAVAVAILAAYGCSATQADIASFTCSAERYVGVNSGGMDQAISTMARPGEAAYITFEPAISSSAVPLPEGCQFVVAHSTKVSNKAETAVVHYNMRVVECRLAAVMLAIRLGYPLSEARQLRTLRECENIVRLYFTPSPDPEEAGIDGKPAKKVVVPEDVRLLDLCTEAAYKHLDEAPYLSHQIQEALQMPLAELFPDFPSASASIAAAIESGFHLQSRAVHVFTEAARVLRFRNICLGTDSNELKLVTLGGLLRKSHESLRDKYDCSCPELEELMVCSRRAGAFGARLTGAGWGGCSVHLVRQSQVPAFIMALKREFYMRKLGDSQHPVTDSALDEHIFATAPGHGAAIATTACIIT
eukprot:jgi/Ulvmu1/2816/UM142_0014.1